MNELAKEQVCLLMHSGVEIWVDKDKQAEVEAQIQQPDVRFTKIQGKLLNLNSIEGIYSARDMQDRTRRKNGQWQCKKSRWHDKNQQCDCYAEDMYPDLTGYGTPAWKGGK